MKILIALLFFLSGCASANYSNISMEERRLEPCKDVYERSGAILKVENPEKKLCEFYCTEWKLWRKKIPKNCKIKGWKLETYLYEEFHPTFRDKGMILIHRSKARPF